MSTLILNQAQVDYVRLGSFDSKQYIQLIQLMRRRFTGWRPKRWLQYKCQVADNNVMYGLGDQNGRHHHIFQCSGSFAQQFLDWLLSIDDSYTSSLYATRIDLQVTKRRPDGLNYHETYKRLAKPKNVILGDQGNTLYIGNRKSDSFWRLYDKDLAQALVRLEVELKGKQAKRAYLSLVQGSKPGDLYNIYLNQSRVPTFLVNHYVLFDHSMGELAELDDDDDPERKLDWLRQLDGLVYKLAKDHDTGDSMRELISRWNEYCSES